MDDHGFELLFRHHYGALCTFALRYVRERSIAEELVQDLFADLWTRRKAWTPRPGSERAYLLAAVRNRALNLRRRQAVERDWERDEAVAEVRALHPRPAQSDQLLEAAELNVDGQRRVTTPRGSEANIGRLPAIGLTWEF